jgi:Heparinase II/III-like protein/Alginate lyase
MLTGEELEARREAIEAAPELAASLARLAARGRRVLERRPRVPTLKGMLTADGGLCPADHAPLVFDPYEPSAHRCSHCGQTVRGERHDWRWAWLEHLWLGERIAELAVTGVLTGDEALASWSASTLEEYARRYPTYRNADNILGPSRLFFSTYLESIWLSNCIAGAFLLREAGVLGDAAGDAVTGMIEESANLIGEFDEGLSNRQTWHNAALAAAAVWFEDEELASRALEGGRGLVGHLVDGFRPDGMWYEGENYHLFALRGLLIGAGWARLAGVDLFEETASLDRLVQALRAPILSALPDGTFPARKDSRFGVSLAQPMYLESWENGVATLTGRPAGPAADEIAGWLRHCYAMPAPPAEIFDAYLHEAGEPEPRTRDRSALSWWALLTMSASLPGELATWDPPSLLLREQGLAILRSEERYVSLECGEYGGGHGHPDRLQLTLHAGGAHWLADPGTGSYVSRNLFWYRSTLAHNAPRVDGVSQPVGDAEPEMFDVSGAWGWVRGRFAQLARTVVAGPRHLVDVVEFADDHEHLVELAWHPDGEWEVETPGRWEPAELTDDFATLAERFVPAAPGPVVWVARRTDRRLTGVFDEAGEVLRARGPGRPGQEGAVSFLVRRQRGRYVRFASVLGFDGSAIASVAFTPGQITVNGAGGTTTHRLTSEGWDVEEAGARVALRGALRSVLPVGIDLPSVGAELYKYVPPEVVVPHADTPPALDGSLDGFSGDETLHLDHEDQYRRTEEPYPGADEFSARVWLAWDETALYVAVDVTQPAPVFRAGNAAPLQLDNENDLIHSDGLQLYLQAEGRPRGAVLAVPDPAGSDLTLRTITGTMTARGAWRKTGEGYRVTLALGVPGWPPGVNEPPTFDLIVNQMRADRVRRLGQLVWTGGGGWAYLRGDRQNPDRAGRLILG